MNESFVLTHLLHQNVYHAWDHTVRGEFKLFELSRVFCILAESLHILLRQRCLCQLERLQLILRFDGLDQFSGDDWIETAV